jgi:hypothetical protein
MSNVSDEQKQQQILGLGRVGWTVRRIAKATGVDRATVRRYLRAVGIPVRGRGRPGEGVAKPAITPEVSTDSRPSNPAISSGVSTDPSPTPTRAPTASACEIYREVITEALGRGRNAMAIWQDLVDDHGCTAQYASVRRFVQKLRGDMPAEARVVITTGPGEDYGEPDVMVSPVGGHRVCP